MVFGWLSTLLCTIATVQALCFGKHRKSCLEVILQVINQEGHVVAQSPLHGIHLGGFQVFPLHLESPAVLKLRLHSTNAQQVPEHNIVPAETSREQVMRTAKTPDWTEHMMTRTYFSRTAGVKRMCSGHWTL